MESIARKVVDQLTLVDLAFNTEESAAAAPDNDKMFNYTSTLLLSWLSFVMLGPRVMGIE